MQKKEQIQEMHLVFSGMPCLGWHRPLGALKQSLALDPIAWKLYHFVWNGPVHE
jgi:hypothetical protein